ncbi:hypothetical protein ACFYNV_22615 [Streptomyces albidoflavus]
MTEPRPADTLRAAAERLRELAAAALGNDRPWRYAKGLPDDSVRTSTGWEVVYGQDPANLHYIAAMHPGVGNALAAWLESWTGIEAAEDGPLPDDLRHALTVARQILGSTA